MRNGCLDTEISSPDLLDLTAVECRWTCNSGGPNRVKAWWWGFKMLLRKRYNHRKNLFSKKVCLFRGEPKTSASTRICVFGHISVFGCGKFRVAPVRFGYGSGMERFERFRFSVPAVPLRRGLLCVFQYSFYQRGRFRFRCNPHKSK